MVYDTVGKNAWRDATCKLASSRASVPMFVELRLAMRSSMGMPVIVEVKKGQEAHPLVVSGVTRRLPDLADPDLRYRQCGLRL